MYHPNGHSARSQPVIGGNTVVSSAVPRSWHSVPGGYRATRVFSSLVSSALNGFSSAGRLGTVFQFLIVTGILYSYTFGAIASYVSFCLACAVWVVLHLLGTVFIPESPYHLMGKGQVDRAAASLRALRDTTDVTAELADIQVSL